MPSSFCEEVDLSSPRKEPLRVVFEQTIHHMYHARGCISVTGSAGMCPRMINLWKRTKRALFVMSCYQSHMSNSLIRRSIRALQLWPFRFVLDTTELQSLEGRFELFNSGRSDLRFSPQNIKLWERTVRALFHTSCNQTDINYVFVCEGRFELFNCGCQDLFSNTLPNLLC